jgi:long-subunit acyl-CoA synthetase (AMP-forming)
VKITDPASGQTVGPGVTGEVCTRGYHVMTGYFPDPGKTAAAIDADGWLHTGDLAAMDERGYCVQRIDTWVSENRPEGRGLHGTS